MKHVCVLGGSGFVGSAIVGKLSLSGYSVNVLTRRRESSKHLILLPNVTVQECDVMDDVALSEALKQADAVINLIGILHNSKKNSFQSRHVELPKRLAAICSKFGIKRVLHMSALQASNQAPSAYLRSKAEGEELLTSNKRITTDYF
jgi:NADH dehydrogenase